MALLFRLRSTDRVYNATTGTTAASNGGAVGSWEPMAGSVACDSLRRSRWANLDRQTSSRQYRHNAFLKFRGDILSNAPEGHFRPRDRAINATIFPNTQSTPTRHPN